MVYPGRQAGSAVAAPRKHLNHPLFRR
jgi:hypothetical protein